jgi:hypothetical protein
MMYINGSGNVGREGADDQGCSGCQMLSALDPSYNPIESPLVSTDSGTSKSRQAPATRTDVTSLSTASTCDDDLLDDRDEDDEKTQPMGSCSRQIGPEVSYVDYCPALYRRLELQDYASVQKFLDTGAWPGTFLPTQDPISPATQARTWVTSFDKRNTNQSPSNSMDGDSSASQTKAKHRSKTGSGIPGVEWSRLAIHFALMHGVPDPIVDRLVELYPASARCADHEGRLPLHLAMQFGASDFVVARLLSKFPAAARVKSLPSPAAFLQPSTPVNSGLTGSRSNRSAIINILHKQLSHDNETTIQHQMKEIHNLQAALANAHKHIKILSESKKKLQTQVDAINRKDKSVGARFPFRRSANVMPSDDKATAKPAGRIEKGAVLHPYTQLLPPLESEKIRIIYPPSCSLTLQEAAARVARKAHSVAPVSLIGKSRPSAVSSFPIADEVSTVGSSGVSVCSIDYSLAENSTTSRSVTFSVDSESAVADSDADDGKRTKQDAAAKRQSILSRIGIKPKTSSASMTDGLGSRISV